MNPTLRLPHLLLLLSALLVPPAGRAAAAVGVEEYSDRAAFEARLAGDVRIVDFDDVETSGDAAVPFAADRYAATKGIVITGTDGQYASRTFTFPRDFNPSSPPNMYAPGPISTSPSDPGGHDTDVTFVAGGLPALVAGFGAVFIDADYPDYGPSSLAVFDAGDAQLAISIPIVGPNASRRFRGWVTVDGATGQPVAAIARAHVVNGSEWPPRDIDDGVPLDDFVFGAPVAATPTTTTLPVPGTTTTVPVPGTTTTTLPAGLIPGGGPAKSDCYAELSVLGIQNPSAGVQKNKIVLCTDGEPCDVGPCGDRQCTIRLRLCVNQRDPNLADCMPPTGLDRVMVKAQGKVKLGVMVPQLLEGGQCGAFLDGTIPVKVTKKGKLLPGKAKLKIAAKARKGTKPRPDNDAVTIQCLPRTAACPPGTGRSLPPG